MYIIYLMYICVRNKDIMTITEQYNKQNPLLGTYKKDGLTLEIREKNYFILLSNGKVTKKGKRLNNELKTYFGV